MITALRIICGCTCAILWITGVLWSVVTAMERVDKVNEQLPPELKFGVLWWYPTKRLRFEREYVRLFPDRKERRKERLLFALGMFGVAGTILMFYPYFR